MSRETSAVPSPSPLHGSQDSGLVPGGVQLGAVIQSNESVPGMTASATSGPISSSPTSQIPADPSYRSSTDHSNVRPATPTPPQAYSQPSQPIPSSSSSSTPNSSPVPTASRSLLPPKTISSHLQKHPDHSAGRAIKTVFPNHNPITRLINRFKIKHSIIHGLSEKEQRHWELRGPELRQRAGWKMGHGEEGVEVSPLFWQMYLSLLPTLQRDPLSGLVPPDLLGSTTTMPLSIISLIPDIMKHYRDVIIRAEKEVFLATNYWQPSNSVNTISQSLRDLSAKVIKEKRPKVVVKIMYDRGSWEQLWNAHAFVKKDQWKPLDLPGAEDIPGLEMEVINFHRVLLGTFHAKFLVVDRKVALINSNNIQDRPNLELMTHLEGPVVDAFYEVALHSWYNKLTPPLPCISTPYTPPIVNGKTQYLFQDHNPYFDDVEILQAAKAARLLLRRQTKDIHAETDDHHSKERFRDVVRKAVEQQRHTLANWQPGEELEMKAKEAMKELREFRDRWALGSRAGSRMGSRRTSQTELGTNHFQDDQTAAITAANAHLTLPSDPSTQHEPLRSKTYPQGPKETHWDALRDKLNLATTESDSHPLTSHEKEITNATEGSSNPSPQVYAQPDHRVMFASDLNLGGTGRFMDHEALVDSPKASSIQLPPSTTSPTAPRPIMRTRPSADLGERSVQGGETEIEKLPVTARLPDEIARKDTLEDGVHGKVTENTENEKKVVVEDVPEGKGSSRLYQMSKRFNATGVLSEAWATVEDSDDLDNFQPHVVHAPHDPFPIAMCCRKPHGFPGHHDIRNPQNAAWLAGFRYAKKKVFIQTPTLNARPIVRAIKQTCRRGVEVVLLLDLGFNDKGESIPFQGGTNEQVVDRLYKKLGSEGKQQHLKVYWYTGKDQVRPLNAVKKQRNCHIKFAAYDDQVLIIGNGNQDSQSWFHSQEVNVMIDSKQIVAEMMETLISNQNTLKYGLVDSDGIWRDEEGKTLVDYGATGGGKYQGLAGFIQFAKTI